VGGVAGVAARRSGDVVAAVETQDADGEVAQASHGPGSVAGADLGGVLGEGDVADVVQRNASMVQCPRTWSGPRGSVMVS
jgi:hypothetical protein